MAFTPKDWKDYPDTSTPINQAALEDMEQRVTAYSRRPVLASDWSAGLFDTAGIGRVYGGGAQSILTSGELHLQGGMTLQANVTISSITFVSSGAGAAMTNQWFVLVRQSDRVVLGITADDTSAAWGANTAKTLSLTSTYMPTSDVPVYIGLCVVGTTMPTFVGNGVSNSTIPGLTPITRGRSNTGLTNPASCPSPVAALTAQTASFFGYVS